MLILLGIAIGAYGLYGLNLHKRKPEKFSKEIKITDEGMRRNYNKFLAITYFGILFVIINLTVLLPGYMTIFLLIPIGIAIGAYGVYGIYLHKRKPEKYREVLEKVREIKVIIGVGKVIDRRKIRIGLIGFFGFLNIIIGLPTLFGIGLLAWGVSLSLRIFIGLTFLPSGILAIVGALVEFKSLLIGSLLSLLAGIFSIFLPLFVNYYLFYALIMLFFPYIPTFVIIVGGILGILKSNKME